MVNRAYNEEPYFDSLMDCSVHCMEDQGRSRASFGQMDGGGMCNAFRVGYQQNREIDRPQSLPDCIFPAPLSSVVSNLAEGVPSASTADPYMGRRGLDADMKDVRRILSYCGK